MDVGESNTITFRYRLQRRYPVSAIFCSMKVVGIANNLFTVSNHGRSPVVDDKDGNREMVL